jgi:CRISPR-associated endoribonuclease Cas6
MSTPFVQIHLTLEHPGTRLPPHALFAIRQLFPAAFRRATGCLTDDGGCNGGPGCPCRPLFDQKLTSDPSALRRYQKPPLPFAFRIPLLPENSVQGASVELSLVIAGEAISHLDLFLGAVKELTGSSERMGGWRTVRNEAASEDGSRILIPSEGVGREFANLPVLSFDEFFSRSCGPCCSVTIDFLTPLRLLHKGVPLREMAFSALAGALFRRVSSLAYYYGGEELTHDFKWLAERSREIACSRSGLSWINRGGGLQGIEGSATFCGELTEFIPFLALGSRLNIGKGAAYGMGSYRFSGY